MERVKKVERKHNPVWKSKSGGGGVPILQKCKHVSEEVFYHGLHVGKN